MRWHSCVCVSAHCPLLQATFDIDPMPLMLPCFSRHLSHEGDAKHAAIPVPHQLHYKHSLPGLLRAAQQGTAPLRTGEATGPRPQGRAVAEAGKTPGLSGLCSLGCPELAQQNMSPATGSQLWKLGPRVFLTQVTWLCSGPCSHTRFPTWSHSHGAAAAAGDLARRHQAREQGAFAPPVLPWGKEEQPPPDSALPASGSGTGERLEHFASGKNTNDAFVSFKEEKASSL